MVLTSDNLEVVNKNLTRENNPKPNDKFEINQDKVTEILNKLEQFENQKGFLTLGLTQFSLASKLQTNTKYLSKIINTYKKKNFSTYINDLKIDYILNELIENKKLKNFNIAGIAELAGFKSAESFNSAFTKKTGLKPSYFIKELEKKDSELIQQFNQTA